VWLQNEGEVVDLIPAIFKFISVSGSTEDVEMCQQKPT